MLRERMKMPTTKILLVDDEPMVQRICAAILRKGGFETIVAENGFDGLEAYRQNHAEICLILSDVTMPIMDGIEMVRTIFEMHSDANVIMMSGRDLSDIVPDDVRRLCSVIEKPFTPEKLIEAVRKCLKYDEDH